MPTIYVMNDETFKMSIYVIDTYGDPTAPLDPFDLDGGKQQQVTVGDDGHNNSQISWTTQVLQGYQDGHGGPMAVKQSDTVHVKAGAPIPKANPDRKSALKEPIGGR